VTFLKVDAGNAAVIDLSEELAEVRAALVPHPGLWDEHWPIACLHYTIGEVDVLAKSHLGESPELLVYIPTNAHVEGAWIELIQFFLSSSISGAKVSKNALFYV
jgi:hypothetical protein